MVLFSTLDHTCSTRRLSLNFEQQGVFFAPLPSLFGRLKVLCLNLKKIPTVCSFLYKALEDPLKNFLQASLIQAI